MSDSEQEADGREKLQDETIEKLLADPAAKSKLLEKLDLENLVSRNKETNPPEPSSESIRWPLPGQYPTLSGRSMGIGQWPPPSPYPPFWWPPMPFSVPPMSADTVRETSASSSTSTSVPGGSDGQGPSSKAGEDEDVIDLLEESEALEMVEFDPSVSPKDSWEPPKAMADFLGKHFNRALSDNEREAIMKDFPKPGCNAMVMPKLDQEVKDQLKRKGRDPHFGAEKSMYKIQEHLLDVAGPLTCLWSDLLNKETTVAPEDILLLVQRALVLLGSASHYVSQERRKIAWSRINPTLKSLSY